MANRSSNVAIPVEFLPAVLDLGTLFQHQTVQRTVTLRNTGTNDLRITAAHASCSCTLVQTNFLNDLLPAGQAVPLVISFDSAARDGDARSLVTIRLEDSHKAYITQIPVVGQVMADISVEPKTLDFGQRAPGSVAAEQVKLAPKAVKDFRIISLVSSRPEFKAAIAQSEGDASNGSPAIIAIRLVAPNTPRRQAIHGNIKVVTTCDRQHELLIPVSAFVVPEVEVTPDVLVRNYRTARPTSQHYRIAVRTRKPSLLDT